MPCERTLQELIGLLSSHNIRLDDEEVALLTFVQHFDFVWENDFMFVGSRKAKGFQKYERTWYKAVYRDGELRIKYSGDAGKQPCSPSIVETEIEYFWPSFNELFDMEHLRSTKCNQQDVFIAGTYLILLRYPALRKYQEPGSGLGIKLVPRLERFELPFSPASSSPEEPQPHRTRQFSSSSEPLPTSVVQSAPNDQRRQSEAGPLAEELNQRETQRKITTMSQSSGRAYAATSQVIVSYSKSVGARTEQSLDEPATIVKTPDPVQQLQNQSPVGGLLNHLLQNIQLSSFVDTFCNGTRLRIVAHLPADRFRPPALKFSPVVWMDISPIIPSRDCIIQALEKIAMSSLSAQQRAARQRGFAARPCGRASSPYRADGNSAEQVQQRQQCHR